MTQAPYSFDATFSDRKRFPLWGHLDIRAARQHSPAKKGFMGTKRA